MNCSYCRAENSEVAKYCSECGHNLKNEGSSTSQLICKSCGALMNYDAEKDRPVLFCPFCGSKEMVYESDNVTIQRIKSNAYKEVEFHRIDREIDLEKSKEEKEEKIDLEKRFYSYKESIWSKITLVAFIICMVVAINAFKERNVIPGLIATIQSFLFALSWLMGMLFVKEKFPRQHYLFMILGIVLTFVYGLENPVSVDKIKKNITIGENQETNEKEGIYTYKIRNYVGKNVASIGEKLQETRVDRYGKGVLNLVFVTENGILINVDDQEQMKQYVVVAQNIPEGAEISMVCLRNSIGKPYENLIDYRSYDEIVLFVAPIGDSSFVPTYTEINPTLDRHKAYIRQYVGRNAASFGQTMSSGRGDDYVHGLLRLSFTSEDGNFVNDSDINELKKYVIVGQDIEPNTELEFDYSKNSNGVEYNNLISSQSYDEINLTVKKLDETIISQMSEIPGEAAAKSDTLNEADDELTLKYKVLLNGNATVTGYEGNGNHVTISKKIDGHEVVSIGKNAFKNCTSLESVLFLAKVESIGEYAFAGCTSLESITIPNKTEEIKAHAFEGCTNLENLIIIGDAEIGDYAFAGCTSLPSVSISSKTPRVGKHAFDGCTSLEIALVIGDDVIIEKDAFANCPGIENRPIQE